MNYSNIFIVGSLMLAFGMPYCHAMDKKASMSMARISISRLGACGLYGFLGWSTYNFIKNSDDYKKPISPKLYKQDFKSLGVKYLDHLQFETPDLEKQSIKQKYYNNKLTELINNHTVAPLYISYINKKIGHGAFADEKINPGQMVGEYTGIVKDEKKFIHDSNENDLKRTTYNFSYPSSAWQREYQSLVIDASAEGNETRFINHSYEPNVEFISIPASDQWHVVFVAKKPIAKDEQLFINYGDGYWYGREKPDERMTREYRFNRVHDSLQNLMEHTL